MLSSAASKAGIQASSSRFITAMATRISNIDAYTSLEFDLCLHAEAVSSTNKSQCVCCIVTSNAHIIGTHMLPETPGDRFMLQKLHLNVPKLDSVLISFHLRLLEVLERALKMNDVSQNL